MYYERAHNSFLLYITLALNALGKGKHSNFAYSFKVCYFK